MLKRLLLLIAITLSLTSLSVPLTVQAQGTYTEGFTFVIQGDAGGAWVSGWVSRDRVTGKAISSQVQMQVSCGGFITNINAVSNVPGDPDRLAVSRDIGWAGLNRSTFTVPTLGPIPNQTMNVTIRANLTATTGVTSGGNSYIRQARWSGRVETSCFTLTNDNTSLIYAQIWSELRPEPYYG